MFEDMDPFDREVEERLKRLEEVVVANKLDAGQAWDRDHMRMARFESGNVLRESKDRFDLEIHDLRYMLHEVTRSINDLSATIKWILISATLIMAVLINILWKILGS